MFAEPYNGPRTCQLCKDDKGRRDSHICFFLFIPGISISVIFRVSKTIGQCGWLPGEREVTLVFKWHHVLPLWQQQVMQPDRLQLPQWHAELLSLEHNTLPGEYLWNVLSRAAWDNPTDTTKGRPVRRLLSHTHCGSNPRSCRVVATGLAVDCWRRITCH